MHPSPVPWFGRIAGSPRLMRWRARKASIDSGFEGRSNEYLLYIQERPGIVVPE